MSIKSIQIKGNNLCNMECVDRDSIIYPETSIQQTLTGSEQTLQDWILYNHHTEEPFGPDIKTGLLEWLETYYPISNTGIQPATYSDVQSPVLGGVTIKRDYLTITSFGELSVNRAALNIPPEVNITTATFGTPGIIGLGNNATLHTNFTNNSIPSKLHKPYNYDQSDYVYAFPLRLDPQNNAGIVIPTSLFNNGGSTPLIWTLDWSKKSENVTITGEETGGTNFNYLLLGNKSLDTNNGNLGYDSTESTTSTDYGYPRFALVAGEGITFTRYTNTFIGNDNVWGGNITEVLISSTGATTTYTAGDGINITDNIISQEAATSTTIGGIKTGYTSTTNRKAVQLDNEGNAFVEVINPVASWVSNGMSRYYFRITKRGYVPLMEITKGTGFSGDFRINQFFRLISRHTCHFMGDFYIDFKNGYPGAIVTRGVVSNKRDGIQHLTANDIYVVKKTTINEGTYNIIDDTAIVYFNVKKLGTDGACTFIVDILGCNDKEGNIPINNYRYRHTDGNDADTLTSSEILSESDFNTLYNSDEHPANWNFEILTDQLVGFTQQS